MRHLQYVEPTIARALLTLMENDGTVIKTYDSPRSFLRIEHDGRMFRLNGQDRETLEHVYLPEVV